MSTEKYIKYNGSYSKILSCNPAKQGKIAIKESVSEIAEEAFINCKDVTEIELPESLVNIGESVFKDCSGLTFITLPNGFYLWC